MTGGGIAFALASEDIAGRVAAEAAGRGCANVGSLSRYPRLFRRTPEWTWLMLMAAWRRILERNPLDKQPHAYARMLRRYMSFFHHVRPIADLVIGR